MEDLAMQSNLYVIKAIMMWYFLLRNDTIVVKLFGVYIYHVKLKYLTTKSNCVCA